MAVVIPNLRMVIESESYIDAMHAVLTHKGWITMPKYRLAGMTAAAFRFTVNRRLTPESPAAYNWIAENFLAADFIGVTAGSAAGFHFDAVFPLYREHAIAQIKRAVDSGIGAIVWKDRFVVAAGYDNERQSLLISNGVSEELEELPYGSFGINDSPYWYYQVLGDRIELDPMEICKESLMQAIHKWETHDPMLPEADYACGRAAYDAIINSLRNRNYDRDGMRTVTRAYAAAKRDIRRYMETLESCWPQLKPAASHYASVELSFQEATRLAALDNELTEEANRKLIRLFAVAAQSEQSAIGVIKRFMRETIHIRKHDIALR